MFSNISEILIPWQRRRFTIAVLPDFCVFLRRQKFHLWVDEQYRKHGLDPDRIEAAGETLRKELEAVTEKSAQQSWERLAGLLKAGKDGEDE